MLWNNVQPLQTDAGSNTGTGRLGEGTRAISEQRKHQQRNAEAMRWTTGSSQDTDAQNSCQNRMEGRTLQPSAPTRVVLHKFPNGLGNNNGVGQGPSPNLYNSASAEHNFLEGFGREGLEYTILIAGR